MKRLRDDRGQALILVAVLMVVILGLAGLTIDAGRKFREDRHLQAVADTAALTGAEALPERANCNPSAADSALGSAGVNNTSDNGAGGATFTPTVSNTDQPNDTIQVTAAADQTGTFSNALDAVGLGSWLFHSSATATAKAHPPSAVQTTSQPVFLVAPLAVLDTTAGVIPGCSSSKPQLYIAQGGGATFAFIDYDTKVVLPKGKTEDDKLMAWMNGGYCGFASGTLSCDGATYPWVSVGQAYPTKSVPKNFSTAAIQCKQLILPVVHSLHSPVTIEGFTVFVMSQNGNC